jgi:hypothetical protein
LWQCSKLFNADSWSQRKKENIVRVFPKVKKSQLNRNNEMYFRQQVILHVPWKDEATLKNSIETWEDAFKRNNLHDEADSVLDLDKGNDKSEDEFDIADDFSEDDQFDDRDDLLLSRLGPKSVVPLCKLGCRPVDLDFDWHEGYKKYEQYGTLSDFQNFIDTMKSKTVEKENINLDENIVTSDFSEDQQKIITAIDKQISIYQDQQQIGCRGKKYIVQGRAGTRFYSIINY